MWSLFYNLKKHSAVGGSIYRYDDNIQSDTDILFEGQKCYRMDYCIQEGAYVFSRAKQAIPYTFVGRISSVSTLKEWSEDGPALYRIQLSREGCDKMICSSVQAEHTNSPYKYKHAAWIKLGLKIPVYKNFSTGIFDHAEDFKLKHHKLRKANKPEDLYKKINVLEDTIKNLEKQIEALHV